MHYCMAHLHCTLYIDYLKVVHVECGAASSPKEKNGLIQYSYYQFVLLTGNAGKKKKWPFLAFTK